MTTKIIGIKDFRQNITNIWREARDKNIRYIVMYHTTPIFEVNPIDEEEMILDNLVGDIKEARSQVKKGETYSETEVYKKLGIK
ncbi:hypothetical protein HOE49_04315 [Candidatus Peregrinibacteria bacterium]|nr:hypothetical protein [Candidatus Peregrinibacteria bacterium]MBT4148472.1 hypothetical protein [Candidatus Peregrinibacteria bacterium]